MTEPAPSTGASVIHDAGPLTDLPENTCVGIADGAAVVLRVGHRVSAFMNTCPHADAPIEGGWVHDGRLICPQHFWAFDPLTGANCRTGADLQPCAVDVSDDRVQVRVPTPLALPSLRDQLLAHARSWSREAPPSSR